MHKILGIAVRNLRRYTRRTLLIVSLIAIGVVFVQVYIAASNSYKGLIIAQITDAMLGHAQIHKRGYLTSIENVPLNLNLKPPAVARIESILKSVPEIKSYSLRIRFGAMLSNYAETTNIRIFAIIPENEFKTVPLLTARIIEGEKALKPGSLMVPELLAKGMSLKVGAPVVLVATNKDGSVNGKQFTVSGIVESAPGPGGRDGYVHIDDAVDLLRMEEREISEVALHLKDFGKLHRTSAKLAALLSKELDDKNRPIFEVHAWEKLSPFSNIAKMVDLMTLFVKLMLISIVLISVMNVMLMSVFERTREIGTLAAIGTLPRTILAMFIAEGFCLGIAGVFLGNVASIALIYAIRLMKFPFAFGMREGFVLMPEVNPWDFLWISALVIVISVIGSIQPAYKASRMEPIKALKSI
jgi:putative ABC transport system permease protein